MPVKMTRPLVVVGLIVCAVAVVFLSTVLILHWKNPGFREEGMPLIFLFDVVFAYRFYVYVKVLKNQAGVGIKTLS